MQKRYPRDTEISGGTEWIRARLLDEFSL
jgi:hypothetical protein